MSSPIIETERTISRPFTMDDLDELAAMRADPDVALYLGDGNPHPREKVETRLKFYIRCYETHGFGSSATFLKGEPALIGACGLQPLEDSGEIEVGYSFIKPLWGQGFATEVAEGWFRYGFLQRELPRIVAVCNPENVGSYRVMEKLGMAHGGMRRHYDMDLTYYAITRDEYLRSRGIS